VCIAWTNDFLIMATGSWCLLAMLFSISYTTSIFQRHVTMLSLPVSTLGNPRIPASIGRCVITNPVWTLNLRSGSFFRSSPLPPWTPERVTASLPGDRPAWLTQSHRTNEHSRDLIHDGPRAFRCWRSHIWPITGRRWSLDEICIYLRQSVQWSHPHSLANAQFMRLWCIINVRDAK